MKLEVEKTVEGTNCIACELDEKRPCTRVCPRNFPVSLEVGPVGAVAVSLAEIVHPNDFNPVCRG